MLLQQLPTASKQYFWPLIWFFIHWTSNFNVSARIRTQYFDSRFVYIWKVENSVFLHLVDHSFHCPSWRSTANSSLAMLHVQCTCFWIFLASGIQSGKETDVGRQRLNRALESLFTFTLLVCRTKQGAWHKRIELIKGSDFLLQELQILSDFSWACIILLAIQHFHTYSFARITSNKPVSATLIRGGGGITSTFCGLVKRSNNNKRHWWRNPDGVRKLCVTYKLRNWPIRSITGV